MIHHIHHEALKHSIHIAGETGGLPYMIGLILSDLSIEIVCREQRITDRACFTRADPQVRERKQGSESTDRPAVFLLLLTKLWGI